MTDNLDIEEQKKIIKMNIIYKALEDGWSVKKSNSDSKTFEFTKNDSINKDYNGLIIYSKSSNIYQDVQKHLDCIKNYKFNKKEHKDNQDKEKKNERSISVPLTKNI